MNTTFGFTPAEQAEIFEVAKEIDAQMDALHEHYNATGTVVPLRTLGYGEEVTLYQRWQIAKARQEAAEQQSWSEDL